MLFSYKIFTLSQLPNKFYIRKSTATHGKSITIHTKPTTTQHRNHQNATTHTTTTTTTKSEIKEIKQIGERADQRENDRWESKSAREWSTIRPGSKGRGRSRKREIGGVNWELSGAISLLRLGLGYDLAAASGVGPLLTLPTLSSFSLSLSFRYVCESFFLSLFLPLRVCEFLSLRIWVPEVIWR